MTDWRERVGGILFGGAIVGAILLTIVHVSYGWGVMAVFVAFIAGALLLANP